MQLCLGQKERKLYSWHYTIRKRIFGFKTKCSLVVTDKRLVKAETRRKKMVETDNYLIDSINSFKIKSNAKTKFLFIILTILFLGLAAGMILGIADVLSGDISLDNLNSIIGIIFGAVSFIIAIIFFTCAFNTTRFTLMIYLNTLEKENGDKKAKKRKHNKEITNKKFIVCNFNDKKSKEITTELSKLILVDLRKK